MHGTERSLVRQTGRYGLFVFGIAVTAMSMSSGFIWASQGRVAPVYAAGFLSWTGYLLAHYAAVGVFVDDVDAAPVGNDHDSNGSDTTGMKSVGGALGYLKDVGPGGIGRTVGFTMGIVILVAGIAILAWYVRHEHHLLGNLGSGMFLGGYVIAHYFDTGKLL